MQLSMQQYKIRKPITERTFHVCPVIFTDHFYSGGSVALHRVCQYRKRDSRYYHNSVSGMDNQILYSSFYSADDGADEASTVFFNDGFGRLTAFEKEYKDGRMTIIIRQNMSIVWKNTYTVSSNHFSVERIDTDGHILFRIHVGERILVGEIDSRDRWIMTEPRKAPRDETMIPLASAGTAEQP